MIDLSCILINYNTSKYSLACIQSILENTLDSVAFEIVIVDNASQKEEYKILKEGIKLLHSDKVKLVRSTINTGFGGGNRIGVKHASACMYYAFINNDTLFVTPETLLKLYTFMKEHPEAAVCSPQMLDEHKNFRKTIDHFASPQREILKRGFLEVINPKRFPNRKKIYTEPLKADYVQGAFMFVNAKDFEEVGGFDKNLFLYYEESDLCRRILKEKSKYTYLISSVEYIHFESASTGSNLTMKIEQKISLFYYLKKHFGWFQLKIVQVYFSIRYLFSSLFKPKYWPLFFLILKGMPMSHSLKYKQKPVND
jgi:GT2 family glycosyltransferase